MSDARNHYPQIKHHTPPPKQGNNTSGVLPQSPIVCLAIPHRLTRTGSSLLLHPTRPTTGNGFLTAHTPPIGASLVVLLRKEVIQPHLPVRLPCYDFVPIADPTFDGSLPCGLGHRLRVLPTFMT